MKNPELLDLLAQAEAILARGKEIKAEKDKAKLKELTDRLEATSQAMEWQTKTEPYTAFKVAESLVLSRKSEIDRNGVKATDLQTGREFSLELHDDRSFLTFSDVPNKVGMTLEIRGTSYFVVSFEFSFSGSTGQLIAALTEANISAPNAKQTPYSAVPSIFDRSTRKFTVAKRNAISPGQIVTISGVKYAPAQTYLKSISPAHISYELQPLEGGKK